MIGIRVDAYIPAAGGMSRVIVRQEMKKIPKQAYTTEFKELAVKQVTDGASISRVAKELGISYQTLRNWVKAAGQGKLKGAGTKVVTPEAMELSRLGAENVRLKREKEIIKKAAACVL